MALPVVNSLGIKDGEVKAADIATGAVGTAEIADNAVTPAEIEDGTQGDIMHYTASGVPARLGAGTSGQVLTSGGSGSNMSWAAAVPGDTTVTEAKLNANAPTNGQVLTADSSAAGGFKWADAAVTYNDDQVQRNIAMLGFYRAIDHSKNEYSLTNQIIDDYNDASGIDASASTNEQRTSGYYVGLGGGNATGGTETTYGSSPTYKVHTFLADGNWVCPGSGTVDYLVVAGGGSGGEWGGGGAGGMLTGTGFAVTAQTYAITVGDGGAGQAPADLGADGEDSVFASHTAVGGGGGGRANDGRNGGSGGGAGAYNCGGSGYPFMCTSHGNGTAGQGNNGGEAYDGGGGCGGYQSGGGGGGAGAAGQNGGTSNGGNGGTGLNNALRTGSNVMYAAGGGGAGYSDGCNPGDSATGNNKAMPNGGASGVGGDGGSPSPYTNVSNGAANATAGDTNTGSGGGGDPESSGAGGSGIVVIRYLDNATFTSEGGDLTLQSTAKTATSAPTTADLVLLIENATGTASENVDIKGYVSRNGSVFTSAVNFTDAGSWGTNKRILAAHDIDLSGITSGTSVKYKITTHNQGSGSKVTRIHATSLGWR